MSDQPFDLLFLAGDLLGDSGSLIRVVREAKAGEFEAMLGADVLEDLLGLDDGAVDEGAGVGDQQDFLNLFIGPCRASEMA